MSLVDELVKNKEELLLKALQFMEGKEASTKINLDDIKFTIGNLSIKFKGEIEVSVMKLPEAKKKGRLFKKS